MADSETYGQVDVYESPYHKDIQERISLVRMVKQQKGPLNYPLQGDYCLTTEELDEIFGKEKPFKRCMTPRTLTTTFDSETETTLVQAANRLVSKGISVSLSTILAELGVINSGRRIKKIIAALRKAGKWNYSIDTRNHGKRKIRFGTQPKAGKRWT